MPTREQALPGRALRMKVPAHRAKLGNAFATDQGAMKLATARIVPKVARIAREAMALEIIGCISPP